MIDAPQPAALRESPLDLERFGVRVAKVSIIASGQAEQACQQALSRGLQMLIARCDSRQLGLVQEMEEQGFRLMDTLVYYTQRLSARLPPNLPADYSWRLATPEDADTVEALSRQTFKGYLGHYHADRRLKREDCDNVYADWARRSCIDPAVAQAVVLVEHQKADGTAELAAFATHSRVDDQTWEGVLYGVAPGHQGRGLYAELIALGGALGVERGHVTMLVSTQITNLSVQKTWCKQGFLPIRSNYTFHAWLEKDATQ